MSSLRSTSSRAPASCLIREATHADTEALVDAVDSLLTELGGSIPDSQDMAQAAAAVIDDPDLGVILLAEVDERLVGVLAASWQIAMHVAGRYGVIQDLWVTPALRSQAIGEQLVESFCEFAAARGMPRIEVGLPSDGFPALAATRAFYTRNGFKELGPRMRRKL